MAEILPIRRKNQNKRSIIMENKITKGEKDIDKTRTTTKPFNTKSVL